MTAQVLQLQIVKEVITLRDIVRISGCDRPLMVRDIDRAKGEFVGRTSSGFDYRGKIADAFKCDNANEVLQYFMGLDDPMAHSLPMEKEQWQRRAENAEKRVLELNQTIYSLQSNVSGAKRSADGLTAELADARRAIAKLTAERDGALNTSEEAQFILSKRIGDRDEAPSGYALPEMPYIDGMGFVYRDEYLIDLTVGPDGYYVATVVGYKLRKTGRWRVRKAAA